GVPRGSYPQDAGALQKKAHKRGDFHSAINRLRQCSRAYARENRELSLCDARVHKSAGACPQLSAVSAYFVYSRLDCVNACVRRDAVPEIENVARRDSECVE